MSLRRWGVGGSCGKYLLVKATARTCSGAFFVCSQSRNQDSDRRFAHSQAPVGDLQQILCRGSRQTGSRVDKTISTLAAQRIANADARLIAGLCA